MVCSVSPARPSCCPLLALPAHRAPSTGTTPHIGVTLHPEYVTPAHIWSSPPRGKVPRRLYRDPALGSITGLALGRAKRQQRHLRFSGSKSLVSDTLIPMVRDQTTDTTKSAISTFQRPPQVHVSTQVRNSGSWAPLWQILCIIQPYKPHSDRYVRIRCFCTDVRFLSYIMSLMSQNRKEVTR